MWNDQDRTTPDTYDPHNPYRVPPPEPFAERGPYWPADSRELQDMGSMPTDPNTDPSIYPQAQPRPRNQADAVRGNYNADGSPYRPSASPYQPNAALDPSGRPPKWPGQQRSMQPAQAPVYTPPALPVPRRQEPYQPAPAQYREAAGAPRSRPQASSGRALPHLPFAHIILVLGVLAMGLSLSQVWGFTSSNTAVYIRDFTNARIQQQTNLDTGALALQIATYLVVAVAVLSAALILFNLVITLFNKGLGLLGLSGCASVLFFPLLWGAALLLGVVLLASAGFAGIGYLNRIPIVNEHSLALVNVAQHGIGFYAWCGGIIAVFIGMLGQLALRRH